MYIHGSYQTHKSPVVMTRLLILSYRFILLFQSLRRVCFRRRKNCCCYWALLVRGKCCWDFPARGECLKALSGGSCFHSDANLFPWDASAVGCRDSESQLACVKHSRNRRGNCCPMKAANRCRDSHSGSMACSRTKEVLCPAEAEEGSLVRSYLFLLSGRF